MEEILASIRRIISEDEEPSPPAKAQPLELTEPASNGADLDDLMVFDEAEPGPPQQQAPAQSPRVAPPAEQPTAYRDSGFTEPAGDQEPIVSEAAYAKASGAFTRLASSMHIAGQGQTLEGVVREILRPMLKEWLDQHLPALVEAKVEAEVQRIARGGR